MKKPPAFSVEPDERIESSEESVKAGPTTSGAELEEEPEPEVEVLTCITNAQTSLVCASSAFDCGPIRYLSFSIFVSIHAWPGNASSYFNKKGPRKESRKDYLRMGKP